jgi:hypothetical protein
VAVAETVNGGVLMGTLGSAGNLIVCGCCDGRVEKYQAPRPCVARASSCKLEFSSRCTPCAWGNPLPTGVQVVYGLGEEYTPVSLDRYIVGLASVSILADQAGRETVRSRCRRTQWIGCRARPDEYFRIVTSIGQK